MHTENAQFENAQFYIFLFGGVWIGMFVLCILHLLWEISGIKSQKIVTVLKSIFGLSKIMKVENKIKRLPGGRRMYALPDLE